MAKKIILADDSITIQKVVRITLADGDYDLLTVDNGNEALEKIKAVKPDLVLLDVVMPGKSGYQVCEEIKKDPELSQIPVILLAGSFEGFDEMKGAEVGADGYIIKPFESQTLISKVEEMLSRAEKPGRKRVVQEPIMQEKTVPIERIPEPSSALEEPKVQLSDEVKNFMASLSSEMDQPAPAQEVAESSREVETTVAETEYLAEQEALATQESEAIPAEGVSEAEQLWGEAELVSEEAAGEEVMEAEMVSEEQLWEVPPMEGEEMVSAEEAVIESPGMAEMVAEPAEAEMVAEPAETEMVAEPIAEPVIEGESEAVGTEAVIEPEAPITAEVPVESYPASPSMETVSETISEAEEIAEPAQEFVAPEVEEPVMETVSISEPIFPEEEPSKEAIPVQEPQLMTSSEVSEHAMEMDQSGIEAKAKEAAEEIATAVQAGISYQELINLIRDTVERVAWEVVPEMAEALIKERIARWEAQTQ